MKITAIIQAFVKTPKTKIFPEKWEEIPMDEVDYYFEQETKFKLSIVVCDANNEPTDTILATRDISEIKKGACYNIAFLDNVFQYNGRDIICLNKVINI